MFVKRLVCARAILTALLAGFLFVVGGAAGRAQSGGYPLWQNTIKADPNPNQPRILQPPAQRVPTTPYEGPASSDAVTLPGVRPGVELPKGPLNLEPGLR